ncbi:MAG: hypothetical protein KKA19_04995 [Candidatus Margulisbacteria bacterium]|nr:hypothetical protein [Candidatus Margulisiibacteriota bacterium]
MKRKRSKKHSLITMGIELETYSILVPENKICRELHFPRPASIEQGERFTKDSSIGTEYNSRVFNTIREAFFLLKNGLRKYTSFHRNGNGSSFHVIFPIGGWTNRFAGSHLHASLVKRGITYEEAKELTNYIYDHIPFIIALTANSPVWNKKITPYASARLFKGSEKYCKVAKRGLLYKQRYRELTFNPASFRKPTTLELRIADSSLPEYLVAALCVYFAVALRWAKGKKPLNQSTHKNYLKARDNAIRLGTKAHLVWSNHWVSVSQYTDLFFRKYEEEFKEMDIPKEIIDIFRYLKKGWNQSNVIRAAVLKCKKKNKSRWERQFASRYIKAIQELLDGNSYRKFVQQLGVKLPNIDRAWLGRKEAHW